MCHRDSKSLSIREVRCSRREIADPPTRLTKKKKCCLQGPRLSRSNLQSSRVHVELRPFVCFKSYQAIHSRVRLRLKTRFGKQVADELCERRWRCCVCPRRHKGARQVRTVLTLGGDVWRLPPPPQSDNPCKHRTSFLTNTTYGLVLFRTFSVSITNPFACPATRLACWLRGAALFVLGFSLCTLTLNFTWHLSVKSHILRETTLSVIVRLNLLPSANISGRVLNQVRVGELDEMRFHLHMLQMTCS